MRGFGENTVGVLGPKDHAAEYGFANNMREFDGNTVGVIENHAENRTKIFIALCL
jgi:hypothetical protein